MPIKRYFETDTHYVMEIDKDRFHALSKATVSQDAAGAAFLQSVLQNEIDVRWRRNQHDSDDPVRNTDPALPYMFWEGDGGMNSTDVVYRPVLVTVTWDGSNMVVEFKRLVPHGE